jgi:hypothetical protein
MERLESTPKDWQVHEAVSGPSGCQVDVTDAD